MTVVDNFSRKFLAIEVGQSLRGDNAVAVLERLKQLQQRILERLQTDNGSEFISKALDKWAYKNGVTLDFSRPGKSTDNALIASFNGNIMAQIINPSNDAGYMRQLKLYRQIVS